MPAPQAGHVVRGGGVREVVAWELGALRLPSPMHTTEGFATYIKRWENAQMQVHLTVPKLPNKRAILNLLEGIPV